MSYVPFDPKKWSVMRSKQEEEEDRTVESISLLSRALSISISLFPVSVLSLSPRGRENKENPQNLRFAITKKFRAGKIKQL